MPILVLAVVLDLVAVVKRSLVRMAVLHFWLQVAPWFIVSWMRVSRSLSIVGPWWPWKNPSVSVSFPMVVFALVAVEARDAARRH